MEKSKCKSMLLRNVFSTIIILIISILLVSLSALVFAGNVSFFIDNILEILILGFLVFAVIMIFYCYIFYQVNDVYKSPKNVALAISIIAMTILTCFGIMRYVHPFAAPLAMSAVLVTILVSYRVGFMANVFTAILVGVMYSFFVYASGGGFAIEANLGIIVSLLQSFCMVFLIKKNYSRIKLLWGALIIGVAFAPVTMVVSVLVYGWTASDVLMAGLWSFVGNAISVGIFTAMLPLYESVFDVWTKFKLADSCSLSRPLLRRLLSEAPGTFNHCLVVANIAESCAMAINEDPYLTKACAIYHDIGKLSNPEYYSENQTDYNPHDDLILEESVKMIVKHTTDGYKLLKSMHMPEQIARVTIEHHGTSPIMAFYIKAKNITEADLDMDEFCYGGPKPTNKISAIVMIADVVEATTRARKPKDMHELRKIVDELLDLKIKEGQFSDCNITFNDIENIKETVVKVVPGIFHKRIDYKAESNK